MFAFWCACLVDRIVDGFEHIGQMRAGHFPIKFFGEAFEIDVGGVHGGVEVGPGFGAHVSGSHGDGMNAERSAGFGRVDGIFGEHDRIVIGERHRIDAPVGRDLRDFLRTCFHAEPVETAGFGNIPILAESATGIAASRAKTQHAGTGVEVVERLLFHWVHGEAGAAAVGVGDDESVVV